MAPWIIALLFAIGASAWIYTKIMRTTGNNTKSSLITAGLSGLLLFFLVLVIVTFINNSIGK